MPVVLRWQRSPGATSYKLQLSADPTFATGLVVNDSTITDTTFQVNGLSVATLYFWHVKAMVSGGQFSLPWSFTTIVGPAATPVLVSPVNGTQGLAVASIDFSWQSAQWATTYRLQVSTDPAFASGIAFDDSTIAGTSRSVTTLQTDRSYYWRVLAKGPGGQGGFSNPWSFETIRTIPLAVSLVYPANGAAGLPTLGLTFRWNRTGSATHYGFQLGTDSTFASGLFKNDTALTDTTRSINGLSDRHPLLLEGPCPQYGGLGRLLTHLVDEHRDPASGTDCARWAPVRIACDGRQRDISLAQTDAFSNPILVRNRTRFTVHVVPKH